MQREVGLQPELVAEERAERLASLLTLSYEPMFAWRLDGQIEFWNAGAERLYGFSSRMRQSEHSRPPLSYKPNSQSNLHSCALTC